MEVTRKVLVIASVVTFLLGSLLMARHVFPGLTLNAFYCAGEAVRTGGNPYLVEPLRSCEHRIALGEPLQIAGGVEPSPLPGYALTFFAGLSVLPPRVAHVLFSWLLLAAVLMAAYAIAKLTRYPLPAVLLALVPAGFINLVYGQIPPIVVAAIAFAGLFLAQRRYALAGVCAAVTMLAPNIGLPSCIALFLWVPQTRKTLLICGGVAIVASIASIGIDRNIAYFRVALPGQAAAELDANDQYSLTRLLYSLGVAGPIALRLGTLSYAAMAVLGVYLGQRLARRLDAPELIIFIPAATVLLGSTYIHDIQMVCALPAAFVLMRRATRGTAVLWAGTILLAIVWDHKWGIYTPLLFVTPLLFPWLIREPATLRVRAIGFAVALAALGAVQLIVHRLPNELASYQRIPMPAAQLEPQRLASDAWNAWLLYNPAQSVPTRANLTEKLPTWFGLIVLIGAGVATSARRRPRDQSL